MRYDESEEDDAEVLDAEVLDVGVLTWLGCAPAALAVLLLLATFVALLYLGAGGALGPGG